MWFLFLLIPVFEKHETKGVFYISFGLRSVLGPDDCVFLCVVVVVVSS